MAAGRSGWHVGSGGSCRHHYRCCCRWRCGRSRGGDREAYHGVPKHKTKTELLTTFQEVAIVDEVTIIEDKASCGADPYIQILAHDPRALALAWV
uniref:RRM domain-containing protein n=1 Tax=Oryza glumipatula TaxID=40148 RepID=A0A0E0AKB8_9ORYZ